MSRAPQTASSISIEFTVFSETRSKYLVPALKCQIDWKDSSDLVPRRTRGFYYRNNKQIHRLVEEHPRPLKFLSTHTSTLETSASLSPPYHLQGLHVLLPLPLGTRDIHDSRYYHYTTSAKSDKFFLR